ncbi:MAG: phage holin family protein [Ekhidna sp.]|nr:phage holin family protein [Ekhidna sp.]
MSNAVSDYIQNISDYIEIKFERLKLKAISKAAKVLSVLISLGLLLMIVFFVVFFLSFGLASLLNDRLESNYLGFLIVSGFYVILVAVVLILFKRKAIQNFFESFLIRQIESEENETKD